MSTPIPNSLIDHVLNQHSDVSTLTINDLYLLLTPEQKEVCASDKQLKALLHACQSRKAPDDEPQVVPQAPGNEHINQVNFFLTQKGNEEDRKVWTAVASTGLTIGQILQAFLHIRGGLQSQINSGERAVPFKYLNADDQKLATARKVGQQDIGPYTAMFVLKQMKDAQYVVTRAGMKITRLGQTCTIGHQGLVVEGKADLLFDGCTVGSRAVNYKTVDGIYGAAQLFFQRYSLLYVDKEWRINVQDAPSGSFLDEVGGDIPRTLIDKLTAKLKGVNDEIHLAMAIIEQALMVEKDASPLFQKIPAAPVTLSDIQAVRDATPTHTAEARIKEQFGLHTVHGKIRNTTWREQAWSNNASLISAAPNMAKQPYEIVQLLDYLSQVVVETGTSPYLYVNAESSTESAWKHFATKAGFTILNSSEKGAFSPIVDNCGNRVVVQHAVVSTDVWGYVKQRSAEAAPSVYVLRVKGDSLPVGDLCRRIGTELPAHWGHVAAVKMGNLHNPQFYLVFTKKKLHEWVTATKISETAVVSSSSSAGETKAEQAIVIMGPNAYKVEGPVTQVVNSPANLSTQVSQAIRRIAHLCAILEKLVMQCYYNGRKFSRSDLQLVLQTMKLANETDESYEGHWHMVDADMTYTKMGQDIMSLATGPVLTEDQRGVVRKARGFVLEAIDDDDNGKREEKKAQ